MTRHIKEEEQSKEAELVRLRTPPRKIWIDLMTGTICDPEPIEHGGHVIPFTVVASVHSVAVLLAAKAFRSSAAYHGVPLEPRA
jgi:hypothetical protein